MNRTNEDRRLDEIWRAIHKIERELEHFRTSEIRPVIAVYTTNAGQSIANNTPVTLDFEDLVLDSHAAVTTGANWKFTAPIGGAYLVDVSVMLGPQATFADGEAVFGYIRKNGTTNEIRIGFSNTHGSGTSTHVFTHANRIMKLAKGDYIDIQFQQQSGGALTIYNGGNASEYNRIAIYLLDK